MYIKMSNMKLKNVKEVDHRGLKGIFTPWSQVYLYDTNEMVAEIPDSTELPADTVEITAEEYQAAYDAAHTPPTYEESVTASLDALTQGQELDEEKQAKLEQARALLLELGLA